jgi:hypothetical protein
MLIDGCELHLLLMLGTNVISRACTARLDPFRVPSMKAVCSLLNSWLRCRWLTGVGKAVRINKAVDDGHIQGWKGYQEEIRTYCFAGAGEWVSVVQRYRDDRFNADQIDACILPQPCRIFTR